MKYEDLTRKIIGCAMKVHCTLGNGFQEVIYPRAMNIEMDKLSLPFTYWTSDQFWIKKLGI